MLLLELKGTGHVDPGNRGEAPIPSFMRRLSETTTRPLKKLQTIEVAGEGNIVEDPPKFASTDAGGFKCRGAIRWPGPGSVSYLPLGGLGAFRSRRGVKVGNRRQVFRVENLGYLVGTERCSKRASLPTDPLRNHPTRANE